MHSIRAMILTGIILSAAAYAAAPEATPLSPMPRMAAVRSTPTSALRSRIVCPTDGSSEKLLHRRQINPSSRWSF
jgi:hypothetical protein